MCNQTIRGWGKLCPSAPLTCEPGSQLAYLEPWLAVSWCHRQAQSGVLSSQVDRQAGCRGLHFMRTSPWLRLAGVASRQRSSTMARRCAFIASRLCTASPLQEAQPPCHACTRDTQRPRGRILLRNVAAACRLPADVVQQLPGLRRRLQRGLRPAAAGLRDREAHQPLRGCPARGHARGVPAGGAGGPHQRLWRHRGLQQARSSTHALVSQGPALQAAPGRAPQWQRRQAALVPTATLGAPAVSSRGQPGPHLQTASSTAGSRLPPNGR